MAQIIDGKVIAEEILQTIKEEVTAYTDNGATAPTLTVVTIGDDPASKIYVNNKKKACEKVGINFENLRFTDTDTFETIDKGITSVLIDDNVAGVIVQLPIISSVLTEEQKEYLKTVVPHFKDVDGFGPASQAALYQNYKRHPDVHYPCTALGIVTLIKKALSTNDLSGLNVLVIGRSDIVGKPVANMLLAENCTVTIAHSRTRELSEMCKVSDYDILISAVGKVNVIRSSYFPFFAPKVIIDVGMNRDETGKLCGDISEKDKAEIVGYGGFYTPVPGGVGPMTVAMLIQNTWNSVKRRNING